MSNPCVLPDDYRKGTYVPRSSNVEQIKATVDVRWSRDEILMHDETNDVPFTITPHQLKTEWKRLDGTY